MLFAAGGRKPAIRAAIRSITYQPRIFICRSIFCPRQLPSVHNKENHMRYGVFFDSRQKDIAK